MKHLKKFLAVALVCVMALTVLTGCGKSAKTYSTEVAGKLGANSGVSADADMDNSAKKLINSIKKMSPTELAALANDPDKAAAKAEQIIKEAGLDINTCKFSLSVSAPGTKLLVGMNGDTVQTGDTSTFFAEQIKKNNADAQNTKITKYGIGTYSVAGLVDIVVMVAQ